MSTKKRMQSLLPLLLGCSLVLVWFGFMRTDVTARAAASIPASQSPTANVADIVWSRVHSSTLDGVVYEDLYWGGIATSRLDMVDIDNDGDLDVFLAGENRQDQQKQELHFYRNDGTSAVPAWTHVTDKYFDELGWASNRPSFVDLDGDSDYDCVLDGGDGYIYYENTGTAWTPSWELRTRDMLGNGQSESQAFADIDGDNDFDLFFTVSEEQNGEWLSTIAFYENTGTAIQLAWTWVTDKYNGITSTVGLHPTFADIDADNDLDLFLGRPEQIIFYRNDGNANTPNWTFVTDIYGGIRYGAGMMHFQVAFGDLDGNNTLDMMIGHELGWVTSFRNTGTVSNASWNLWQDGLFPMNYGGIANPALADIDADGDADLFLGMGSPGLGDSDGFVFLRNDGTVALPAWTYVTGSYGGIDCCIGDKHPAFVDINGDGDLDLFIGTGPFFSNQDGTLHYYENTGTPTVASFTPISDTYLGIVGPYYSRVDPAFTDIDADGDQDLFVSVEGQIHHYRNDGNATSPVWTHVTDAYASVSALYLAFADVDGDGDQDMLSDSAFYRNDGDATAAVWAQGTTPEGLAWSGGPLALADLLDNDGRPDLLLGGNGGVHLYRNLGDLPPQVTYTAPSTGGSGLRASSIVAAFNNTMDAGTMTSGNVSVVGSVSGAMTGTVIYEAATRQLVFMPQEPYTEGETVQVTLKAAITDAGGHGLDGDGDGMEEGSPTDDYLWSFIVHERDHLVVSLPYEPASLYLYDGDGLESDHVLAALYDGPFGTRSYGYQPVILNKLPSVEDGDALINRVTVEAGDPVVNADYKVVTLTVGTVVRPAGCRSSDCAVVFDGAPLQMDQLVVTFELLPDIMWSDGITLTADDSLYSYEIHQAEPWLSTPRLPPTSYHLAHTASYEALDSLRTRWTGLPGFIDSRYNLIFWHPLPRHAWGHLTPEQLHTAPESTRTPLSWGPYAVSNWEPGVAITLTTNPYYYRAAEGLPTIDTLVFHFTDNDPNLALAQVLAGEADATTTGYAGLPDTLLNFASYGVVNAHVRPGIVWEHADFGVDVVDSYVRPDFFEDREMRQAIAYCLDRDAIANAATAGYVSKLNTYISPEHPLYPGDENLTIYPHNVASGTLLLESLGWTDTNSDGIRECNGCTTPGAVEDDLLSFKWQSTTADMRIQYMQTARENLAECGIDLTLQNILFTEYFANGPDGPLFGRHYDIGSFAWLTGVEPPCSLYLSDQIPSEDNNWSGQNNTGWSNVAFDAACTTAQQSLPGSAAYVDNHYEAMRILSEEVPMIPLFSRLTVAAAHPRLIGLRLDPDIAILLDNVGTWAFLADGLPPEGTLHAGDGSPSQNTTPVTLHLDATDYGGGTVEQMFLRERTWDGSDWAIVAETGWIPYATSYGWDLDPTPAAHYLSAYFMDDSGNTSLLPAQTVVNLTPASGDILADEIVVYRVRMEAGGSFTATLTTHSGDADLYVWAPGNEGAPDFYSNLDGTAEDSVVVTDTVAGDYHVEVQGYAVASAYHLDLEASQGQPGLLAMVENREMAPQAKSIPAAPLTSDTPDNTPAEAPGGLPDVVDLRAPRLTLSPGGSTVQVTAEVWDQKGAHVPNGTVVTFATTLGTFASSATTTTTVAIKDGLARATLVSGDKEGIAQVTASAGTPAANLAFNFRWPHKVYLPLVLRE